MAPPAANDPPSCPTDLMHVMSLDRYEYMFDWAAALVHILTHNLFEGEARGLRCFALPKGFSTHHSGVRGHYLINESATGGHTVEFLDDSLPDSLAIALRFAENKKLYVQQIKLPLMSVSTKSSDSSKEVSQTDAAPILSKLETIKSFKTIVNNDGCALAKQVDKRPALKYALRFKAINLTTLNKC
eukprot:1769996-Pleurochrysis_carterae.AAC.1